MELKGIMSISGNGGLFKVLTQTKTGFVVESMADGKRMAVSGNQRISMLEDISIYTQTDDRLLSEVLMQLHKLYPDGVVLKIKDDASEIKKIFAEVLPDYDTERVYVSDIKKVFGWYNLLREKVSFEPVAEVAEQEANQKDKE